jgi:hypothetical membrane protein
MNKKIFAICGILAPVSFTVFLVIFSILTPGYSNLTNAVSELGTSDAPYALAWSVFGFVLVGLLIAAFAWGLHADLRQSPGAIGVPTLIGISGIGFAALGLFPADAGFAPSVRTTLHFTMVSINFLPFLLATFVFAIRLQSNEYWKKWILFSIIMGILGIASFFIPKSIPGGLSQRIGLAAYFLWLFVNSLALLRKEWNLGRRNVLRSSPEPVRLDSIR